jgi:two-component sensor histidine kinase
VFPRGSRRGDTRPGRARSLRGRFGLSTLGLVLVISTVFVVVEGYRSYEREVDRLNDQLSQIEQSHIPSIVSSLWLTDSALLQSQAEAIARFPHIDRVEVVDTEGTVFSAGTPATGGLTEQTRTLTYSRRDARFDVGTLRIYVNQGRLRAEALGAELFSTVSHVVLAFVIAVAVAVLFRRQVGVHLERLVGFVERTGAPDDDRSFSLDRRRDHGDELHRLVNAVNEMRRRLRADVRERELLISEIHHRIKNDMGFVKALLSLQAARSAAPETATALNEASQRIAVMGRTYERLYRGDDVLHVELGPLVEQIVGDFRARGILPIDAVEITVENITVTTRISVAIGMVLNELVTNAAKHAFSSVVEPRIRVTVRNATDAAGRTVAELSVADNGEGFPGDVLREESAGYGLTVVRALVEQHDGVLELRNDAGAVAIVRL